MVRKVKTSTISGGVQRGEPTDVQEAKPGVMADKRRFLCGVVEGFYGRPWTMEQRKELFRRMKRWGLNTYMYAPKDDSKHRVFWREMYSVEEADQLMALVSAAREHEIEFVYAISPGLDMSFSNPKEVATLKRKLEQVAQFGCHGFALLYDDIEQNMCPADKEVFSSFAYAQVSVTNEVFQHLGEPSTFLFCPTEYCGSLSFPSVIQSPYLQTVGEKLLPGIDVLWTGPKVVSKEVSLESIEEVSKMIKRRPVIWDNIHANDYDQKRLFLGPFKGRSTELIPRLGGVLTNPNCEFEANYVAIHTLATWYRSNMHGVRKDAVLESEDSAVAVQIKLENEGSDEELETDFLYSPRAALRLALTDWLQDFGLRPAAAAVIAPRSGSQVAITPRLSVSGPRAPSETFNTTVYTHPITSINSSSPGSSTSRDEEPMETASFKVGDAVAEQDGVRAVEGPKPMDTDRENSIDRISRNVTQQSRVPSERVDLLHPSIERLPKENEPDVEKDENDNADVDVDDGEGSGLELSKDIALDQRQVHSGFAPMQTDDGLETHPNCVIEPVTMEDLGLLADLFYLPYEHGPRAVQLLRNFHWLKVNSGSVGVSKDDDESISAQVEEWRTRAALFDQLSCRVTQMFTRLSNIANRRILYDLYPYIWDIKSIISLVKSFVKWLDGRVQSEVYCSDAGSDSAPCCREKDPSQFLTGDQEPWVFRGGLAGEFQRMLPIDGANDLFFQPPPLPPSAKVYTIRPYLNTDESGVYRVCRETYADGMDASPLVPEKPDLIGDWMVGGLITLSPDYCFVLEDEYGICGYALGAVHAMEFNCRFASSWLPTMQDKYRRPDTAEKLSLSLELMLNFHSEPPVLPAALTSHFPSLVRLDIHSRVNDPSVAKSMLGCLLSSLKANGSQGVFCEVKLLDKRSLDFYARLGFVEAPKMDGLPKDLIFLCRPI
uniref:protein O-GlcNAcase n=1 Tax=Eptatretus burgeri TaxID=7764 RepID=A0A8C4WYV4_EPTBU